MLSVCVVGWERERDWGVARKPKPWHQPSHDTGAAALPAPRPAPRGPAPITLLLSIVCCVWEGSGGRCTLYHTCQQARLAQTCVHVDAHTHKLTRPESATRYRGKTGSSYPDTKTRELTAGVETGPKGIGSAISRTVERWERSQGYPWPLSGKACALLESL